MSMSTSSSERDLRPRFWLTRWHSRIPFALKFSIHIALMILLSGITLTVLLANRYEKELFHRENQTVFTVFAATLGYLQAHYLSHDDLFVGEDLSYMLREKFLRVERPTGREIAHRPENLALYNLSGQALYRYREVEGLVLATNLAPAELPDAYTQWYDPTNRVIHARGPIRPRTNTVAYVFMQFPTDIEAQLGAIYRRSLAITGIILLIALAISALFARQALRPITLLTRAARRVHRGDFTQRIPVQSHDEIGGLTATFNEMMDTLNHRVKIMYRLQNATVRISRELDKDRLHQGMAEMFMRMSDAQAYRFYMRISGTQKLEPVYENGSDRLPPPDRDSLTRLAFQERWIQYLLPDGRMTGEPGEVIELAIPLLSGRHRVGVIRLGPREDRAPYDSDTITILQTLAQQASVSVDNADLLEQLAEKERIEQEMHLAREMQEGMLPKALPDIPGYEAYGGSTPAFEVGGDYYDVVPTANCRLHLLVGDVSGKGVPAAFIMSILRSLFHSFAESNPSPTEICRIVNRSISRDISPEMFITLGDIGLDPRHHRAHIVRAGHEPALLIHKNGEVETLRPNGAAFGLLDAEAFNHSLEEVSIDIAPGDTLMLYTDGITEARNREGEEFGSERLVEHLETHASLHPHALYTSLFETIQEFSRGAHQADDITMMFLRRR